MTIKDRSRLTTEKRNRKSKDIDRLSTQQIVDLINDEDARVAVAVGRERKHIARAVDMIVEHFGKGGRLFYVGAGAGGRLGVLDASKCPPTFGASASMVQGIIAGAFHSYPAHAGKRRSFRSLPVSLSLSRRRVSFTAWRSSFVETLHARQEVRAESILYVQVCAQAVVLSFKSLTWCSSGTSSMSSPPRLSQEKTHPQHLTISQWL